MPFLVAETDLCDAYLLQPDPVPAEGDAPPPFGAGDLRELTGAEVSFGKETHLTLSDKAPENKDNNTSSANGMLIRALSGRLYCLATDQRRDASTCGQTECYILSRKWGQMLWLPPGFACTFSAPGGESTASLTTAG